MDSLVFYLSQKRKEKLVANNFSKYEIKLILALGIFVVIVNQFLKYK